jgi:CubicO group peptidase (beta-lactamase class C family)
MYEALLSIGGTFVLIILSTSVVAQNKDRALTSDDELINWVQATLDSAMKINDIPALSIGIIRDNRLLFKDGMGVKKRGQKERANEESVFQIGSLSKMFTGIIANNLIAEGTLDPKESIVTYLPETLAEKTRKRLESVSVENLLQHKAGFRRDAPTNRRKNQNAPLLIEYTEADMIRDLNKIKLKFEPGTDFSYSNYGYAVLGFICEQITGLSYPDLLQKYVTEKYDLSNTFIRPNEEQLKSTPTPYKPNNRTKETKAWKMGKLSPAGGVYSNAADLIKFMSYQMQAYHQFVNKDLRDPLILTNKTDPVGLHYGFGLYKNVKEDRTFYFHGGDLDGFSSVYIFSPKFNIGMVILTSSGGSWLHYDVTDKIIDKLIASMP